MLKFLLRGALLLPVLLLPVLLLAARPATAQTLPPDTLVCDRFADNEQGWFVGEAATRTATLGPADGYHLRYTGAPPAGGAPATAVFALHDQLRRERLANLSSVATMDGLDGIAANGQWLYFGRRSLTENTPGDVY